MLKQERQTRSRSFRVETLETRDLMTLITAPPTINALVGKGVTHNQYGGISIIQPAKIQVYGTATPAYNGSNVYVQIFAEDSQGTIVNNGMALATVKPDFLGQYHATVTLPSKLRADINYLFAREVATATQTSQIALNPSTITGLSGTLNLSGTSLSGLTGTINSPSTPLTGLSGTLTTPSTTISNLGGTITTPDTTLSGLGGTFTIPQTPITNIQGTISTPSFPITTPTGAGTGGPIVGGSLTNGTGTLGTQTGTIAGGSGTIAGTSSTLGGGSGTIAGSTSTLSVTSGTLGGTTSTLTQTGTASITPATGTFTDGTGTIAATNGTLTTPEVEVAVSNPLVVLIHQPKTAGHTTRSTASLKTIKVATTSDANEVAASVAAYEAHHAK